MKIFSSQQIKEWDNYTINKERVSSHELMERAAIACYDWLTKNFSSQNSFKIFCGKGNNGGDGLAIARMLIENRYDVSIYIIETGTFGTDDFQNNLAWLYTRTNNIRFIDAADNLPDINNYDIVIDALLGTGLNKPAEKLFKAVIEHLNRSSATLISIDMPSGLYADKSSKENVAIKADHTLTFQQYKFAFLMAENEEYFGKIVLLDIGLHKDFYDMQDFTSILVDEHLVKSIFKPRKAFSNKGDYGHACLLAGSYGMMGAAVLSARACLKSGAGKLTCIVCKKGYNIMQICAPEAMSNTFGTKYIKDVEDFENYQALGIGPGIGRHESHKDLLQSVFKNFKKPVVIDADAINVMSENKKLLLDLPEESILTPHPKEFERLFGKVNNDFERMQLALNKAEELKAFIVLKGHHTLITTPGKKAYFNSTGNAGMAKGGSGDVLTGVLTGLLAQGYSPLDTCLLGVYLHGMAGDIAAEKLSQEAMIASDITNCLGEAFIKLS